MTTLDEFVAAAKNAWPEWSGVHEAGFRHFVSTLRSDEGAPADLRSLRAADLWLAFHAAHGHPKAQHALEVGCFRDLVSHLCARRASPSQAEEAVQRLRHRLLAAGPEASAGRLLSYSGRGDLRAWVRVAALRTWLNLERETARERAQPSDDLLVDRAAGDLELEFLKGAYRESFHRAFLEALAGLPADERLMLKMHYLDKASMEEIGRIVGAHRITVLRRLERTREQLASDTKRRLSERHQLTGTEVESLLRLIQSRLDLSLRHAFEEQARQDAPQGALGTRRSDVG